MGRILRTSRNGIDLVCPCVVQRARVAARAVVTNPEVVDTLHSAAIEPNPHEMSLPRLAPYVAWDHRRVDVDGAARVDDTAVPHAAPSKVLVHVSRHSQQDAAPALVQLRQRVPQVGVAEIVVRLVKVAPVDCVAAVAEPVRAM